MKPIANAEARRRLLLQLGLAAAFVVSVAFVTTACIFDQGHYDGGGRLGQAATANQQSVSSSSSSSSGGDDDETSSGTASSSSSGNIGFLPDGGLADAH